MSVIQTVLWFYLTGHKTNKDVRAPEWYHKTSTPDLAIDYITRFIDALVGKTKEEKWSCLKFNMLHNYQAIPHFHKTKIANDSLKLSRFMLDTIVIGFVARMLSFGYDKNSEIMAFSNLCSEMFDQVYPDLREALEIEDGWSLRGSLNSLLCYTFLDRNKEEALKLVNEREWNIIERFVAGL